MFKVERVWWAFRGRLNRRINKRAKQGLLFVAFGKGGLTGSLLVFKEV